MFEFRVSVVARVLIVGLFLAGCGPFSMADPTPSAADARALNTVAEDNGIALEISTRFLQERYRFSFLNIGSNVYDGRVLLTGTVESPDEKAGAENVVKWVDGVREVINEIQVASRGHLKDPTMDVTVERNISTKLASVAGSKSRNYRWSCVNGVVYFIGIAQDRRELNRVVAAARSMSAVRKVVSHVRVR